MSYFLHVYVFVCSNIIFLLNCFIKIFVVEKNVRGLKELCCFSCILAFWQLYAFVKLTNQMYG